MKFFIFQMESGKFLGIGNLPFEFYKFRYEIIKNDLLQLYKSILFHGENLTQTMNLVVIKTILKNDETQSLKH